jgi:hypothetical protein
MASRQYIPRKRATADAFERTSTFEVANVTFEIKTSTFEVANVTFEPES